MMAVKLSVGFGQESISHRALVPYLSSVPSLLPYSFFLAFFILPSSSFEIKPPVLEPLFYLPYTPRHSPFIKTGTLPQDKASRAMVLTKAREQILEISEGNENMQKEIEEIKRNNESLLEQIQKIEGSGAGK